MRAGDWIPPFSEKQLKKSLPPPILPLPLSLLTTPTPLTCSAHLCTQLPLPTAMWPQRSSGGGAAADPDLRRSRDLTPGCLWVNAIFTGTLSQDM